MAIKDEYEVARLYTDGSFQKALATQFEGDLKLTFHLAPPILGRKDERGHAVKTTFGPWMMRAFGVLAKLRGLRGGPLDIFGRTAERKWERRLLAEYEVILDEVLGKLTRERLAEAIELLGVRAKIRGYGHVKQANGEKVAAEEAALLARFRAEPSRPALAAE
jgi:indolepyruvate ferredoxin oxidoreductase